MKELQRLLEPIRRKLWIENYIKWLLRIGIVGTSIGIVVGIVSKFWYITDFTYLCVALVGITVIGAMLAVFFFDRPDTAQAARVGDFLGFEERFITAWEILQKKEEKTTLEALAVADSLEKARTPALAKQYHLQIPKKMGYVFLFLCLGLLLTGMTGSPRQAEAEVYAQAQLKKIEQIRKEINHDKETDAQAMKEFRKITADLTKKLKRAKNKQEAEQAVRKAQEEMKKLDKKSVSSDLKKVAEQLGQKEATKELAKALENGNSQEIEKAMKELMDKVNAMSEEQKKDLAQKLLQGAEAMENKELSETMKSLANALSEANMEQISAMSSQMQNQLMQLAQQNASLRDVISSLDAKLAQGSAGDIKGKNDMEATPMQQQKKESSKKQQGQRQGDGQGEGQGQGQGQGQGSGGGSGTGTGTGRGEGHQEMEEIYTRKAENKDGFDAQLEGEKSGNGDSTAFQQKTTGTAGESLPYDAVLDTYRNEALRDLENEDVPYGMRELVSEYFTALEQ